MNKIENIIFDFGGVLYNIDLERSKLAFKKLGFYLPERKDEIIKIFNDLEIGALNPTEFISQLQDISPSHPAKEAILEAFNSILVGIDPDKVNDLREIKKKYNLYLLSNTSTIHYNIFSKEIRNNKLTADFYDLFSKEYYSFDLGIRKPDLLIYKHVLDDSNLNPFGTLFVDDSYENISAASSLGIQTFHFENNTSWNKLIDMLKLK